MSDQKELRTAFDKHLADWRVHQKSVRFSSNSKDYIDCEAYRQLVKLGQPIIPLVIEHYSKAGNGLDGILWGHLMQDITKVKLMEKPDGSDWFDDHRERWLKWYAEHEA